MHVHRGPIPTTGPGRAVQEDLRYRRPRVDEIRCDDDVSFRIVQIISRHGAPIRHRSQGGPVPPQPVGDDLNSPGPVLHGFSHVPGKRHRVSNVGPPIRIKDEGDREVTAAIDRLHGPRRTVPCGVNQARGNRVGHMSDPARIEPDRGCRDAHIQGRCHPLASRPMGDPKRTRGVVTVGNRGMSSWVDRQRYRLAIERRIHYLCRPLAAGEGREFEALAVDLRVGDHRFVRDGIDRDRRGSVEPMLDRRRGPPTRGRVRVTNVEISARGLDHVADANLSLRVDPDRASATTATNRGVRPARGTPRGINESPTALIAQLREPGRVDSH